MPSVSARYAARSIRRNVRRTALAVVGISVGCLLAVFMESMNRGRDELFARAGAYSGAGHVRIVPTGWSERRDVKLRLADPNADLAAADALPETLAAAPRARADALLAMGTRVVPVPLIGVDPIREPRVDRFVRTLRAGRYLLPGDAGAIVVGQAIADRLAAGVDDDVLGTLVGANGDIESAMYRIVGVVATGSEDLDLTIAHVPLGDLAQLSGRRGAAEVSIILKDWQRTDTVRASLRDRLAGRDDVLTWGELNPEFQGHMKQDQASSRVISAIVLFIVLLGVASAQLAAVLERRREFAVLAALGMPTWTMVRLVLEEAALLGVAGGAVSLAVAVPLVKHFATAGLDLTRYLGGSWSFSGFFIEPIIYFDFGTWMVPYIFGVALSSTLLASLYPARFAARTDPAVALRVAQ